MLEKVKAFFVKTGKKGKAMLFAAIMAVSTCAMTVAASAAEVAPVAETGGDTTGTSIDFATVMQNAGDQLGNSFNALIQTMIPVILTIMGSAIVIYGVIALIKLGKKIFGHVAG